MTLAPLAAWLLVCGALIRSPLLYRDEIEPEPARWAFMLVALALLALNPHAHRDRPPASSTRISLGILGTIGGLAAPSMEWCVMFVLLAIVALVPLRGPLSRLGSSHRALADCARIGIAIGLAQLYLPSLIARVHDLPALHGPVARLLACLGIAGGTGADSLSLYAPGSSVELVVSTEKLAIAPAACLLLGVLAAGGPGLTLRRLAWLAGTWVAFLALRAAIVLALFASGSPPTIFYKPWPVLLSLLPLALAWSLAPTPDAAPRQSLKDQAPRSWSRVLLATSGASVLVASLSAYDPGVPKGARILFDEAHSEWAWTDEPLDTSSYGERTTYNYASMFAFLRHYFAAVDRNYERLTRELLAGYDVLVLKTPTEPYAASERAAVHEFVRQGGGLWLIGDHTNVFGMSSCLDPIAADFGIHFRWDAVDDLSMHEQQVFHPPTLGVHPILAHMPDSLMATSCSLELEPGVEAPMLGDTLYADHVRFAASNFFGDHALDGTERFGWFVQAAATRLGAGRVVAYADSTTLSNFSFFFPGKWELTLGTLEWLDRRNGAALFAWVRPLGLALGMLAILAALRRRAEDDGEWMLAAAACGVLVGGRFADALTRASYPLPRASNEIAIVGFETERSRVRFPIHHQTHDFDSDSLHTFAVWTQRLDLVPRVAPTLEQCLAEATVVVLAWPTGVTESELDLVRAFVERGGKLLVLDDDFKVESDSNRVLAAFGLKFGDPARERRALLGGIAGYGPERNISLASARVVEGGTPFLKSAAGESLGSSTDFGTGRVAALGLGRSFSVKRLGQNDIVPDPTQLALAEIEYHAFRDVFGLEPTPPVGTSRNHGRRRER